MSHDSISIKQALITHQQQLKQCRQCPDMIPPVITGNPATGKILLVGQAPGDKEGHLQRPFAWTAGKTLFKWFDRIGVEETHFRSHVYMAAICRCFPGKQPKGGDRVPNAVEIQQCSQWLKREIELLQPELVIPVGKLAIVTLMQMKKSSKLNDIIGKDYAYELYGHSTTLIPLPHPSGASTWHHTEIGKQLLDKALAKIAQHPQWRAIKQLQ